MSVNHDETISSTNTEVISERCFHTGRKSESTQEMDHKSQELIICEAPDFNEEDDLDELVVLATKCAVGMLRGGPVGLLISLGMHFLFSDD